MLIHLAALICAAILCTNAHASADSSKEYIKTVFEGLGYKPVCVASALASCERFVNADYHIHVAELIPELNSLLQEIKCDNIISNCASSDDNNINIAASLKEVKALLAGLRFENTELSKDTYDHCCKNLEISRKKVPDFEKSLKVARNCGIPANVLNKPKNCFDILKLGDLTSGVRVVYPFTDSEDKPVVVYCDQTTDGGGWTLIQNRDTLPIREDFYRNWTDYTEGFGSPYGEFWLGLESIFTLANSVPSELRIDLEDYEGNERFAAYKVFNIGDAASMYELKIGDFSGDAGDSMARHNGFKFSSFDEDHNVCVVMCCTGERHGAWWYKNCNDSNLNGYPRTRYESSKYRGIMWDTFNGVYFYLIKKASMKVRPLFTRCA